MPNTNKPNENTGAASSPVAPVSGEKDGADARHPAASSPSPDQAALDKEAAKLEAKADDAQDKADALAADAQKAEERAEDFGLPRAARCPVDGCRERLERYTGDNPHKVGTHFCPKHGRMTL